MHPPARVQVVVRGGDVNACAAVFYRVNCPCFISPLPLLATLVFLQLGHSQANNRAEIIIRVHFLGEYNKSTGNRGGTARTVQGPGDSQGVHGGELHWKTVKG